MSFLKFILKNPFRRKTSAILAIIGISVGIATIIALGAITDGMVDSLEDTIHSGGADFTIIGKDYGESAYMTSTIDSNWTEIISNVEGVYDLYPVYVINTHSDIQPFIILIGLQSEGSSLADLSVNEGRLYEDGKYEIVVGKLFADDMDLKVGDEVNIEGKPFKTVGIFESGDPQNDMSIFTSIDTVAELKNDKDHISNIYVKVDKGLDSKIVADKIEDEYGDNISVVSSVMEMDQMADSLNMMRSASLAISLLAIIVGALGIINTMLMNVLERTRELGVLKAVGWSNRRILFMIICESLVITLVSGIVGSILGVSLSEILCPLMGLSPVYTITIFAYALTIAIIVGILGGIYPAFKAVKLPPTEALRYE